MVNKEGPPRDPPLEAVLTTLQHHLEALSTADFPVELAATVAELQQKLLTGERFSFDGLTRAQDEGGHRYEDLMRFMTNAYLVSDLDLNIRECNVAASRMFDLPREQLPGRQIDSFFSQREQDALREKARQVIEGTSQEQEWESAITRASGELPVLVKTGLVRGEDMAPAGIQWLFQDITRRKQTNARLQRTYKLLLALVEASPLGIVMLDMQGRVQLWSEAAERILGWSQEEVLGQQPAHFPSATTDYGPPPVASQEMRADEYEVTCLRKDGKPILVRSVAAAIRDSDGQVIGRLEIFSDITQQQRLRVELQQMKARLAASRDAEQRRLARGLHDDVIQELIALQMELASYRREAERGTAPPAGGDLARTFGRIETQVVATVRELRGVLRELRPAGLEEYGLVTALEGYITQLARQYSDHPIQIRREWPPAPLSLTLSVATCLFRVAQEALRNIFRHSRATHVDLVVTQGDGQIVMEISDNGAGFGDQPRYTRLAAEGHFGLVGMLERVELVGGQLEIRSTPGKGATILVRIPLSVEE